MKTYQLYILSILSGILISLAWPQQGFAIIAFIAFVPLLKIEYHFFEQSQFTLVKVFGFSYLTFLIWNLLTTYWVWNSSPVGGILAFSLNTLFMSFIFTFFHFLHKKVGNKLGYLSLVCFWISYEFLHQDWDLSWTWLILGNVFSENFRWIQWYEYTGVFGGTLWVWLVNILVFIAIKNSKSLLPKKGELVYKPILFAFALIIIPIAISYLIFYSYNEKSNPIEVVVVQPNIDPYNEKFDGMTASEQLSKMLRLAEIKVTPNTQYLVGPETALVEGIIENDIERYNSIRTIRQYLKTHPDLKMVIGISSYREFLQGETPSETARKSGNGGYYDAYNTAAQIDTSTIIQIYHKSKLVPGVEKMPFGDLLKPLEELAFSLGGTSGSLGMQKTRSVFKNQKNSEMLIAPVVCYESIYGEYVGEYVRNGAKVIFIITNDGWWGNTPGFRQHCSYARLRAIEHRRSIARSANTGISCFLNQRGEISQATSYWKEACIIANLNQNSELTFYTRFGDYIARTAMALSLLVLAWTAFKKFFN